MIKAGRSTDPLSGALAMSEIKLLGGDLDIGFPAWSELKRMLANLSKATRAAPRSFAGMT
jgi:hypothetical protein